MFKVLIDETKSMRDYFRLLKEDPEKADKLAHMMFWETLSQTQIGSTALPSVEKIVFTPSSSTCSPSVPMASSSMMAKKSPLFNSVQQTILNDAFQRRLHLDKRFLPEICRLVQCATLACQVSPTQEQIAKYFQERNKREQQKLELTRFWLSCGNKPGEQSSSGSANADTKLRLTPRDYWKIVLDDPNEASSAITP